MVRKLIWKCLQFQSQSRKDFLTSGKNVSSNQKAAVKVNQPNEKAIKFPQNIECENLSNHKINKLQHGEYFARYLCTRFFFYFFIFATLTRSFSDTWTTRWSKPYRVRTFYFYFPWYFSYILRFFHDRHISKIEAILEQGQETPPNPQHGAIFSFC